jgi:hypothetical protein
MQESVKISSLERVALATRYVLAGALAVVLWGALSGGTQTVNAGAGISAAPEYVSLTLSANASKFYIIDTNSRTICVYSNNGDALRLVSVRKFDLDEEIFDGSIKAPIAIEGGSGVTRENVEAYLKNTKPMLSKYQLTTNP